MSPTRLCTVEAVKNKGNINIAYEYDDSGLVLAIRAATIAIFVATRRKWELGEYIERIPIPRAQVRGTVRIWTGVQPIWLSPVTPIISFSESFSSVGTTIAGSSYDINPTTGRIDIDPYVFSGLAPYIEGQGFIRVSYVGGLGSTVTDADVFDAPDDLVQACAMQASFMYDRTINSNVGVKQSSGKTGSITYTQYTNGLVPEAHALVSHYIRPLTGG